VPALHLNTKHELIGVHVVSTGTLDSAIIDPRDVFKAACLSNAAGLLLIHNHPSEDPAPSPDNRALVAR
jgi:DNA repair protein RadC